MKRLKLPLASLALFCLGVTGTLCAQAVVEGRVTLPKGHPATVINNRYAMNGEQAVIQPDPPAAVVYLEGSFPLPKSTPRAQMVQKDLAFVTPLLPVLVGTTVEFPNQDQTYHNIFSFSKPKRFDLGRYRSGEVPVPSVVCDKPGVVALHCDIHEHMHGIVLVLETPFFQLTDPAGNYQLANLPPGHYKLKAWLDNKTLLEHEVDLKAGARLRVDFP